MNQVNTHNYSHLNSLGEMWDLLVSNFGDIVALSDPHSKPNVNLTYKEVEKNIKQFANSLQFLNINSGGKIALFADNSPRWLIADQGIIYNGCADAVRSSQADKKELLYILDHSDSIVLVIQDLATLNKLNPEIKEFKLKAIILLSDEVIEEEFSQPIYNFQQFIAL